MNLRTTFTAIFAAAALITASGCAVTRDQSTVGEYVDDVAITTSVKARFVENKNVDAASIKVRASLARDWKSLLSLAPLRGLSGVQTAPARRIAR